MIRVLIYILAQNLDHNASLYTEECERRQGLRQYEAGWVTLQGYMSNISYLGSYTPAGQSPTGLQGLSALISF